MSRGRPRHQSSRRRMYSARQRDVRERRLHEDGDAPGVRPGWRAVEIDEAATSSHRPPGASSLHARASAA